MKYKVGDKVRIRKDLKFGSGYGNRYVSAYMEKFSNKVVTIKYVGEDYYGIEEDDYCDWTDEMIEGLWEECKLRLIDILNKIANGELKEGTKVKVKGLDGYTNEYKFVKNVEDEPQKYDLQDSNGRYVFDEFYLSALEDEVELIEPNDFADDGKMAEPTDNTKIERLDVVKYDPMLYNPHAIMGKIIENRNKLNEVIRYINKGVEK